MSGKKTLAVLGAGNMGTAVAFVLADNGHQVKIWNWEGDIEPLKQIEKYHENKKYLPKVKLSDNIIPCYKIAEAVKDAEVIFFVVPSGVMEHTVSFAARNIKHNAVLVDVSKGIDSHSFGLIPYVMMKHVRPELKKNILCISGPAIAKQMAHRQFTAMSIAGKNKQAIKKVKQVMENNYIKLIISDDMIGVEVGGSFKNVYSIAMGICDALGYGLNTKAALIVSAISEMADLIKAMGGKRYTAYELSGLGDLIGTALCEDSRNRRFGEYLGKGMSGKTALKKAGQTVEGVEAARCLMILAEKYRIKLPFAETIYQCIHGKGQAGNRIKKYLKQCSF